MPYYIRTHLLLRSGFLLSHRNKPDLTVLKRMSTVLSLCNEINREILICCDFIEKDIVIEIERRFSKNVHHAFFYINIISQNSFKLWSTTYLFISWCLWTKYCVTRLCKVCHHRYKCFSLCIFFGICDDYEGSTHRAVQYAPMQRTGCVLVGKCQVILRKVWTRTIVGSVFGMCHALGTLMISFVNFENKKVDLGRKRCPYPALYISSGSQTSFPWLSKSTYFSLL